MVTDIVAATQRQEAEADPSDATPSVVAGIRAPARWHPRSSGRGGTRVAALTRSPWGGEARLRGGPPRRRADAVTGTLPAGDLGLLRPHRHRGDVAEGRTTDVLNATSIVGPHATCDHICYPKYVCRHILCEIWRVINLEEVK